MRLTEPRPALVDEAAVLQVIRDYHPQMGEGEARLLARLVALRAMDAVYEAVREARPASRARG